MKIINSEKINSSWRKLYPDIVHDFTTEPRFTTEPIKEIMKEIVVMGKKKKKLQWWKICLYGYRRNWEHLWNEDDLIEMNASKPVPDNEEEDLEKAVLERKFMLDYLAEGLQLFKIAFDFFYDMDPSMIRSLELL